MGLWDSLKNKIAGEDGTSGYDSIYDDGNDIYGTDPYAEDPADEVEAGEEETYTPAASASVSMGGMSLNGSAIELKVVKPDRYESVPQIADHLLNKRTVVLNLEAANKETARRLIDFLSGVAYSIGGHIKRVANNAYVITPNNVEISGDQMKAKMAAAEGADNGEAEQN